MCCGGGIGVMVLMWGDDGGWCWLWCVCVCDVDIDEVRYYDHLDKGCRVGRDVGMCIKWQRG